MALIQQQKDRYYLNKFGIYETQYTKAFNYANKNWFKLVQNASTTYIRNPIPISRQIARACNIPESAASDIAQSISLLRGL